MKLPEDNIHWKAALEKVRDQPGRFEICMTPSIFILEENSFPAFLVDWSSFDAREAQQQLKRIAFARCRREDCGIRLGNDQEPGDDCGNH